VARSSSESLDDGESRHSVDPEDLPDLCSRPKCRREFRRLVGPGRRQEYCSETCRRNAEKELRQARSRLAHFEQLVRVLRSDVATFGRPEPGSGLDGGVVAMGDVRVAEAAVSRAEGVLVFADLSDPAVQELRRLYEAVGPIILAREIAS
jgi:hypothetical protein